MPDLTGKVAIVTGAAGGIGFEHARLMIEAGAKVLLTDLDDARGVPAAQGLGENASFIKHNVTSEADWDAVIAKAETDHGRLDILVNNAGIMVGGSIEEIGVDDLQKALTINTTSVFIGCKKAIPVMEKSGGGSIVNIASISGSWGEPDRLAYGASKAAVDNITKSVAIYCHQKDNNIRCNSVRPDGVITPLATGVAVEMGMSEDDAKAVLGSLRRMCPPEDIAQVVVFLASDDARFVSGANIPVDNGISQMPAPQF